ncbi:MAG: AAA family ATPase [Phycisphaerales bacterium]
MLITRLWKNQPGKYFLIATKSANGKWSDVFFSRKELRDVDEFIRDNADKDLYFCPHGFSKPKKLKEHAVLPTLLWSDMDEADPRKTKLKPTIAIESSPGRYVGIWMLDQTMSEDINRRLAYGLGADVSGWDLTQVLRIPGTTNYKYESMPKTRLMWVDGPTWDLKDLDRKLPAEEVSSTETSDAATIFKKYKSGLPQWARRELMTRKIPKPGKRSEMLWKLANTLLEAGIPDQEAFTMIKASVWNKFHGRRNEDQQLRREWEKCINKHLSASKPVAGDYEHDYQYLAKPICDIEERDLDWVWYPWLARKQVTILEGDPEAGKSFIAQYISARVCLGKRVPCEDKSREVIEGPVAYFDVENEISAVTKKRLRWFGGYDTLPNFYQEEKPFSIDDEDEMEKVFEAIERVRPAMIVFDTLNTYIGSANTNHGAQSQQSFVKFLELARRFDCAVLVLRHLTKGGRDKAMYRGQGNIAFTGVCRIQILAGKHPTDPDLRVMARSKGNLTKKPRSLIYEVADGSDDQEKDKAKFRWHGFADIDAEEIVAVEAGKDDKKERHEAREFLLEALEPGPLEWHRIEKMAEARSISPRTIRRAGDELKIIKKSTGFGKNKTSTWELPDH